MRPSDWLLLFLAAPPGDALDPVRVQKGMFLLAMQAPLTADERYAFEPYAYGPMSRLLYRDARDLGNLGLVSAMQTEAGSWRALQLTRSGTRRAASLRGRAERERPETLAEIDAIRAEIDGLSFAALLERVYDRYPEYAVRSVFRRPR